MTATISPYVIPGTQKKYTPASILQTVAECTNMSIEQIKQRTRKREIVEARHIAQVLIIKFTKTSTIKAGEYTGGYDHSTVLHAQRTVSTIPSLNRKYKRIEKQLKEKHNAIN